MAKIKKTKALSVVAKARKNTSLTQRDVAEALELDLTTYNQKESKTGKLRFTRAELIALALLFGCPLEDLTGKEENTKYKINRKPPIVISQENIEAAAFSKPFIVVPIVNDIPAGFDYGSGDAQRDPGYFEEGWPMATRNKRAFWMRVKGDSMEPEYHHGDLLAIEPIGDGHLAEMDERDVAAFVAQFDGKDVIYMLSDGHCAFKHFEIDPGGNYWFTCRNPAMADMKAGPYRPKDLFRMWPVSGQFRLHL